MVVMARETWTDGRMDEFKASVNRRFDEIDRRFDEVDKRFEQVDKRFEQVDKRFEQIERRLDRIEDRMHNGFFLLVGMQATSTLTLVGLMVGLKVF
jgi:uncharacterized protein Yka (UPF0111/DUF47 family)